MTADQALRILRMPQGKRIVGDRRELARAHVRMLAEKYAVGAMGRLMTLIDKGEEGGLKAAVEMLSLAGMRRGQGQGKKEEKGRRWRELTKAEEDFQEEVGAAMAQRMREKAAAGKGKGRV